MKLISEVLCVFILSVVQQCSSNQFTALSFKIYRRDKLVQKFYEESVKSSEIECGLICSSTNLCFAFGFHKIRNACFLYDHFPTDCGSVSEDSGMLLYIPTVKNKENVAIGKPTGMSSEKHNMSSCRGVDGDYTTFFHTHKVTFSWWCVDLLKHYDFTKITIHNRNETNNIPSRFRNFEIGFKNDGSCNNATYLTATWCYKDDQPVKIIYDITGCNMPANPPFGSRFIFIKLQKVPMHALHFRELIVSVS